MIKYMVIVCGLTAGLSSTAPATTSTLHSESQPLDATTPEPHTVVWKTERDLTLLFEDSDDRILLAEHIMSQCIANASLPEQVRIDGLRISGFVCYRDGDLPKAELAFSEVLNLTQSDRWLAEAGRVLGQISVSKGQLQEALDLYTAAWPHAEADDPQGHFASTRSVLSQICTLAHELGEHQTSLDYALLGILIYDGAQGWDHPTAPYLYWAYKSNKSLGDPIAAADYLTDLLSEHPGFGEEDDFLGLKPILLMDLHALQGHTWSDPSKELIDEAIGIINNERFRFMPSRLHIVDGFTRMLEGFDKHAVAIEVRGYVHADLESGLSAESGIDQFLKNLLLDRSRELLYSNAVTYNTALNDPQAALGVLSSLLASSPPLSASLQDRVSALTSQIEAQMQPVGDP